MPERATGRTGASWPKECTVTFLQICLPYADKLRCSSVPEDVYQHISDILFATDCCKLNYSALQLREKVKTLKDYFSQTKKGKRGGRSWHFYALMEQLFDRPIEDSLSE